MCLESQAAFYMKTVHHVKDIGRVLCWTSIHFPKLKCLEKHARGTHKHLGESNCQRHQTLGPRKVTWLIRRVGLDSTVREDLGQKWPGVHLVTPHYVHPVSIFLWTFLSSSDSEDCQESSRFRLSHGLSLLTFALKSTAHLQSSFQAKARGVAIRPQVKRKPKGKELCSGSYYLFSFHGL